MNRLIRGILYIVAGCAGIGCAALILGLALGRGKVDFTDYGSLNFAKNTAYNIVVKVENKLRGWLNRNGNGNGGDAAETEVSVTEGFVMEGKGHDECIGRLNVSCDQVKQLDIELAHGYLNICEADGNGDQIWVETDEDIDGISITCKGDKILIRDNRSGSARRKDVQIYMEVPHYVEFQNISIQLSAGAVEIQDLIMAETMTLNADAGEIRAEQLQIGKFTASVGTGLVVIDEGIFSGNVKLECGVGQIELYETLMNGDARISCGMGNIDIELVDDVKNANYILNCGMGSIDIGDKSYTALSSEKHINNDAAHTFTLDCGMGAIYIE